MSKDHEAGVETDTGQDSGRARKASGGARAVTGLVPLVIVLALLVASAAVLVVVVRQHQATQSEADARRDAVAAAEQFTLRLDSLDYEDIPGYQKRVSALLTPKMRSDFTTSFKGFDQAFTSIQFASKGEIKATGVSSIDDDSATVLVIHDVKVTTKGCVQPPYKRMKVDLRLIKGKWLVDDFEEGVPGCQG